MTVHLVRNAVFKNESFFIFRFFRYVDIAFAFRTFNFRRYVGIALAIVADAAQQGSSWDRFPNVHEAAARAKPSSHDSYVPRACQDIPRALSVSLVALRRVRCSLIVEPRHVRAVSGLRFAMQFFCNVLAKGSLRAVAMTYTDKICPHPSSHTSLSCESPS